MINVLIADDHRLFRKGIINILKEYDSIRVAGEAENGTDLINKYFELKPDLIIADISMPDMSGIDAFEEILKRDKDAKALFLSMHGEEEYIYRVYRSGGKGLVSKNYLEDELPKIIQMVYRGEVFFGREWTKDLLDDLVKKYDSMGGGENPADVESLTDREKEVFKMIGEGYSSNEISDILFISKRTVDHHRENIKEKLGVGSFHEVFKLAVEYLMKS